MRDIKKIEPAVRSGFVSFTKVYRTRSGDRTRTDIAAHGILSPACLPIPPSEHSVKRHKYNYFSELSYGMET